MVTISQSTLVGFVDVARFACPELAEGFTSVRVKLITIIVFLCRPHGGNTSTGSGATDRASVTKSIRTKESALFFENFYKPQNPLEAEKIIYNSPVSTSSLPLSRAQGGKLRPINIIRDLPKIADLAELCFHQNMDQEGKSYVQQMRASKKNTSWFASTSLPLKGFVWEEDKKIVGNISIVPFQHQKEKIILFANVAVHPDHRRRGIARLLTQKALDHVRKIKPASVWVHVEEKNQGAINLYRSLGFQSQMLRKTWRATTQLPPPQAQNRLALAKSPARYWLAEEKSLAASYPPEMRWYRMPNLDLFAPGLKNWLERVFLEVELNHWVLADESRFAASLFWMARRRHRAPLWLATAPQTDDATLSAFLLHARSYFVAQNRELSIDYPAGEREAAFKEAGFTPLRTLLWMRR